MFLFALPVVQCHARNSKQTNLEYEISISKNEIRTVKVVAKLTMQLPYLQMDQFGIPAEISDGWASFVKINTIIDESGNDIVYSWDRRQKKWLLNILPSTNIIIDYEVTLNHDSYQWNSVGGIDGRPALLSEQTAFWVAKALFIYPQAKMQETIKVTFNLPKEWKVSTPWFKVEEQTFKAQSLEALLNNALMLGAYHEQQISIDGMSILIAVEPVLAHRIGLFTQTLEKVLLVYKEIFGELPNATYLVCGSKHIFEDGEAFFNSFHQLFVDQDLEERRIVWGNVLAHEMFHYWNGTHFLVGENVNTNSWFSEGFTEYYSNLALVRAGLISKEEYLQKLAYQLARFYGSQAFTNQKVNLLEAGNQKAKNWHLIYGGGASIAFILDIEIRLLTNGRKSLDDYMKTLYERFGKTHSKLVLQDQINTLNELTGSDFKPFFDSYISGGQFYLIPILQACEKAGLKVAHYQGEFYLKDKGGTIFETLIEPVVQY